MAKININVCNLRDFMSLPGMYPIIAKKILKNQPYKSVDDIFEIDDLTLREREVINRHMGEFEVSDSWS